MPVLSMIGAGRRFWRVCRIADPRWERVPGVPGHHQMVKSLINAAEGEEIERPLEAIAGALAATTADLKEGIAAFRDKRKPKFSGK